MRPQSWGGARLRTGHACDRERRVSSYFVESVVWYSQIALCPLMTAPHRKALGPEPQIGFYLQLDRAISEMMTPTSRATRFNHVENETFPRNALFVRTFVGMDDTRLCHVSSAYRASNLQIQGTISHGVTT